MEPTDEDVENAIVEWLKTGDLMTTSKKKMRVEVNYSIYISELKLSRDIVQLEQKYQWSLESRKQIINRTLDDYLEQQRLSEEPAQVCF